MTLSQEKVTDVIAISEKRRGTSPPVMERG